MRTGNDNAAGIIIICIAIFVGAILALYFLSKVLVMVGIIAIIISIIVLLVGIFSESGELALLGGLGIIAGLILLGIGATGVNFFEHNPTGQNVLEASNAIVNSTKQGVQAYTNAIG